MEKLKFDFDEMVRLASDNPTEFTRRREALIHQVMATSPQSANLIDLQMDVDAERYGPWFQPVDATDWLNRSAGVS